MIMFALIYQLISNPSVIDKSKHEQFLLALKNNDSIEAIKCFNFDEIFNYLINKPELFDAQGHEERVKLFFIRHRNHFKNLYTGKAFIDKFIGALQISACYDEQNKTFFLNNIFSVCVEGQNLFLITFRNVISKQLTKI